MKIGIISDVHDHQLNLKKVLKYFEKNGIRIILFCGDVCAASTLQLIKNFDLEVHLVFGNVDDKLNLMLKKPENVKIYNFFGEAEIEKRKVFFTHFPEIADLAVNSKKYDAIFYGHTHEAKVEKVEKVWKVNPGDLMGLKAKPSFAIYDLKREEVKIKWLK
jgi:putative phosphoesterase